MMGILQGANEGSISHQAIVQSIFPAVNRRSVLGITRSAAWVEPQRNMSGPQPSSRYLAGSRYQAGKDLEKREGFVGTAVGTISCANTSYDLSIEM